MTSASCRERMANCSTMVSTVPVAPDGAQGIETGLRSAELPTPASDFGSLALIGHGPAASRIAKLRGAPSNGSTWSLVVVRRSITKRHSPDLLSSAQRLRHSAVPAPGHSGAPGQPHACAHARPCRMCLRRASCCVPLLLPTLMPGKKPDAMRPPGQLGRRRCVLHLLTAGRLRVAQVPHSQSETVWLHALSLRALATHDPWRRKGKRGRRRRTTHRDRDLDDIALSARGVGARGPRGTRRNAANARAGWQQACGEQRAPSQIFPR